MKRIAERVAIALLLVLIFLLLILLALQTPVPPDCLYEPDNPACQQH